MKNILNILFCLAVTAVLTQSASAASSIPDASSTSVLTGVAAIGLGIARRFIK